MPFSTIDRSSDYFRIKLYTGNGTSQSITFDETKSMQPEFVWIKKRNAIDDNVVFDAVRGATKRIQTNQTNAETTYSGALTSFDSNGFSLGDAGYLNESAKTYVAWSFDANGTGVSNTAGTISSTVSANTTSGFSIVSYTGNGTGGATIGHGLGAVPKMIIIKGRATTYNWVVGHNSLSTNWGKYLTLSTTDAVETATNVFNDTAPTSSLFSIGTALGVNTSSSTYIAYCFAEVKGFSKAFSYTGNGSTDGSYVHLGFRPAFVMIKRTDSASQWVMFDVARNTYNLTNLELYPNGSDAEVAGARSIDILSNGFKARTTSADTNASGGTYVGISFASNPFVSSKGVPVCAR